MHRLLVILALGGLVVLAAPAASLGGTGGAPDESPTAPPGFELPQGPLELQGENAGGGCDGDPDDLGGGFRSAQGQAKIQGVRPPVRPFLDGIDVSRIWMLFVH